MSLITILKEIEKTTPEANTEVDSRNPNTYRARLGLKNAAVETLKRLKVNYRKELMNSTAFIVVTGSEKDGFAQLASSDTFGCFSVDPDSFFKDLTARVSPPNIQPSLFGREGVRHLFNVAQNVLEDKMMELDITSYPGLSFNERYNTFIKTAEEFTPLIRTAIVDQVGSEVVGVSAIHSIVDNAIEKGHSAPVTPIVLATDDEKFALDLKNNLTRLTKKVFLVSAGKASKTLKTTKDVVLVKTVSEETVGEALTSIRNKIL